jgi:hypothetical protein
MLAAFRNPISRLAANMTAKSLATANTTTAVRTYSSHKKETDEEFDNRWESYFKK